MTLIEGRNKEASLIKRYQAKVTTVYKQLM
jgi:hypothetical protein